MPAAIAARTVDLMSFAVDGTSLSDGMFVLYIVFSF